MKYFENSQFENVEFNNHIKYVIYRMHFHNDVIFDEQLSQAHRIRIKRVVRIKQSENYWILIEGWGGDDYPYSYLLLGIVPEDINLQFKLGEVELFDNEWHFHLEITSIDSDGSIEIQDKYYQAPEGWIQKKASLMLTDELVSTISFKYY